MTTEAALALFAGVVAVAGVLGAVVFWMLERSDQRADERETRQIDAVLALKAAMAPRPQTFQRPRRPIGFEELRGRRASEPPPPPGSFAEPVRAEEEEPLDGDLVHMVEARDDGSPWC